MRTSTWAWIWVAQVIGGSTPALTKLALEGLGPFGLVVVRQLLGTLFLLALAGLGPQLRGGSPARPARWTRRDAGLLLVVGWAGFALPQILGAIGLTRSSATHGALLSPLEPIGILFGAAFVLREPLRFAHGLATVLGLAGTLLIVWPSPASVDGEATASGDVILAAGHLCWAFYTLAAKPLVARHDPLHVAIAAGAISWVPLLPFALAEPLDPARALPSLGWVLLLALLATAVGTLAWNRALREVSAVTMAAFVFVQPLVGLGVGALFLGERAGLAAIAGAALVVLGAAAATLAESRGAAALASRAGEPAP